MSQAFYTAMSGIGAAQQHINVVADNIANLNTVGFKESIVTFQDVFYSTLSAGTAPTRENGGTNPKQIGVGTQIGSIDKNFNGGSLLTTGRATDLHIQGPSFFCVQAPNGEMLYTKAGNFTVDPDGNFVMPNGYRVMGADSLFDTKTSKTPIHIPPLISTETIASPNNIIEQKPLNDLNGVNISPGTYTVNVTWFDGVDTVVTPIEVDMTNTTNMLGIVSATNAAFNNAGLPADILGKLRAEIKDGKMEITIDGFDPNDPSASPIQSLAFKSGTSNFLGTTQLASSSNVDGVYSTRVLDYQQIVNPPDVLIEAQPYSGINVYEDGTIEVTYSNGDKLSVIKHPVDNTNIFKYTTSKGIIITGEDVKMNNNVCEPANLQLQMAMFMNPNGLTAHGSNLFASGPNAGNVFYGVADSGAFGTIKSGGLEGSNVDLARQFADMITAQRSIEANSRVFDAANQVMKTLSYMGQ